MSLSGLLSALRQKLPLVAPSMLKCDFGNLARDVRQLEDADVQMLHWDVMDGQFVPNLSYGAMVIARLRKRTELCFEAHLMISDPLRYVDEFIQAGCQWITVHYEAADDIRPVLQRIREAGRLAGVAINPKTPVSAIADLVPDLDSLLVMSVEPGFGGQSFLPESPKKLQEARRLIGPERLLSVDGGVGPETVASCASAGANVFVVGSAIFDRLDFRAAVGDLSSLARNS